MKAYSGVDVYPHAFLISARDAGLVFRLKVCHSSWENRIVWSAVHILFTATNIYWPKFKFGWRKIRAFMDTIKYFMVPQTL
jgi:hypothetical protein